MGDTERLGTVFVARFYGHGGLEHAQAGTLPELAVLCAKSGRVAEIAVGDGPEIGRLFMMGKMAWYEGGASPGGPARDATPPAVATIESRIALCAEEKVELLTRLGALRYGSPDSDFKIGDEGAGGFTLYYYNRNLCTWLVGARIK